MLPQRACVAPRRDGGPTEGRRRSSDGWRHHEPAEPRHPGLRRRRSHSAPPLAARDSAAAARVHHFLHGPREHRVRDARRDERRSRHGCDDGRPRRRHLLLRLPVPADSRRPARGARQRQGLHRVVARELGRAVGADRARHAHVAVARAALPARRGRGRDAAGRTDDGQPLVSRPRTRPRECDGHPVRAARRHDHRAAVRLHPRRIRLASPVLLRGRAVAAVPRRLDAVRRRRPGDRALGVAAREGVHPRRAARRAGTQARGRHAGGHVVRRAAAPPDDLAAHRDQLLLSGRHLRLYDVVADPAEKSHAQRDGPGRPARDAAVRRDGDRDARHVVLVRPDRQATPVRAAAAGRIRRVPRAVGAHACIDGRVVRVPDRLRLLPAGGGRRVLGDSAEALQRRGGRQRPRPDQRARQSRRLLRPVCGRRADAARERGGRRLQPRGHARGGRAARADAAEALRGLTNPRDSERHTGDPS
ncbi:hypothetical protein F01_420084 [Burkholderia cenocepacia]|nr:hypothetical protein F01_420084 [Burkholderia cenocepacia]